MSAIKFQRFRSTVEAELMLDGAIRIPLPFKGNEVIYGLNGLTLTFAAPSTTVTFTDASNIGRSLADIIGEIDGDTSHALKGVFFTGTLYIVQPTPSAAVNLNCATSTAAAKLGLPTSGNLIGKKYAAWDGAAPRVLSLQPSPQNDSIIVMTEE